MTPASISSELVEAMKQLMEIIDIGVSVNISDEALRSAHPADRRFIKRTRKALDAANAAIAKAEQVSV